jgi:alkylhydroperoxidase family enzyme
MRDPHLKYLLLLALLQIAAAAGAQDKTRDEKLESEATPKQVAAFLSKAYGDSLPPEGAKMLLAIANGSQMGPGEGWFGPAETRFDWNWLATKCGVDPKAPGISKDKFAGPPELFAVLDRNRDGSIQAMDIDWNDANPYVEMSYTLNRIFRRLDAKGAGGVTKEEWQKFFDDASSGKEKLTAEDFSGALLAGYTGSFARGDGPDVAMLVRGLFAGEIGSMFEGPKVGQRAPVFQLRKADGEGSIELSSLLGEKPLVIVLGNFTCGPFRSFYPAVDALYKKYEGRANFLMVYVREAHPTDGWKMESNARAGVAVAQPTTFEERSGVAQQFCTKLKPSMPVVVDELSDPVGHAYSGMPARLYVIDTQGRVAFKSGRGPFGFKPPELEQALAMCLLETIPAQERTAPAAAVEKSQIMSDTEAWKILPEVIKGRDEPLPNWAKAVARQLPRTAAAMLQLDFAQRTKSPLDPKLRAKMRLVIAHANRCEYSKKTALADLKRAGASEDEVNALLGGPAAWPEADNAALRFAYEHSLSAPQIEDALFEQLRKQFGDKQAAAMVLLGAYGNFQDRILLGLGIAPEGDEPLPPLEIVFAPTAFQTMPILPPNKPAPELLAGGKDVVEEDEDWGTISYEELQTRLKKQLEREQRLPTPSWEEVAKNLPPEFNARPTRIVWNLVCMGYVPELALPWSTTTRTMWAEAQQDRVLEESLFWVQTRAVECNYCMGHCEMLLEVAGLNKEQITDRLKRLASDDWSAFPAHEQRTFAYARKLSKTPWELTQDDYRQLEQDLGKKEAMATFFWLCRGLYMTRVSDGFQLRLEADNVFADFAKQTKAK